MRDPYEILGVSANDDLRTIRKAYKRLAVAHHPDRSPHPDAAERFKQVTEAYAVLTNERAQSALRTSSSPAAPAQSRPAASARSSGYDPQAAYARAAEHFRSRSAAHTTGREWVDRARPQPPRRRVTRADIIAASLGNVAAVALMLVYLWRSSDLLPLQPWLPAHEFAAHSLSSPIWMTLWLGLSMIVCPQWYVVPIVVEERRSIRLTGWVFLLVFPFLSAWLLALPPHFRLEM